MKKKQKRSQSSATRLRALKRRASDLRTTERNLALAQRAVNKFRPKKSERMTFVFLSKNGKRIKASGRVGYSVYIARNGKKRLVDKLIKRKVRPRLLDEFSLRRTRKKTAIKKLRVKIERLEPEGKIRSAKSPGDFPATMKQIQGSLSRLASKIGPRKGTWRVDLSFSTTEKTYEIGINVPVLDLSNYSRNFARVWSGIAELLDDDGLVSRGSSSAVYRTNRGVRRGDWQWKGRKWMKTKNEVTDITSIAWKFSRLAKSSGE